MQDHQARSVEKTPQTLCPPLKTKRGSRVARHSPVGKKVGSSIYVHREYASLVVPGKLLKTATAIANEASFQFTCIKYDTLTSVVRFDEAPNFDTAREPTVGKMLTISRDGTAIVSRTSAIWHHKWMWVLDDYSGFGVPESYAWSKRWLSVLTEAAKSSQPAWLTQLGYHHL